MNVLIYSGEGVLATSFEHTRDSLRALLSHRYDVMAVDASVLRNEPWTEQCALLVFPGGRDLPYVKDLAGTANQRILAYMRRGGRYLGFCAGAYYASARVEFEVGTPLEVMGSRELGLFPGVCRGSVFAGFESGDGARAARIRVELGAVENEELPGEIRLFHHGGGAFLDADSAPTVTVLARYVDPDARVGDLSVFGAAAVVDCQVGRGRAILMGVHPEYIPSRLDPAEFTVTDGQNLVEELIRENPARERLLRVLLTRLGLQTPPEGVVEVPACTPLYLACASETLLKRIVDAWATRFVPGTTTICDTHDVLQVVEGGFAGSIPVNEKVVVVIPAGSPIPASVAPAFNLGKYLEYLEERQQNSKSATTEAGVPGQLTFGSALLYAAVAESTQTLLEMNTLFSESLPNGFTFTATRQLRGRGRGRNAWISPSGCLQFSTYLIHSMNGAASPVFVQYLAALAVVQAIKEREGYEDVPLFLKWPNDIYVERLETGTCGVKAHVKVGGVLVNSSFQEEDFRLVVGVGVDLDSTMPTTSINEVIAYQNAAHRAAGRGTAPLQPLTAEDLLASSLCKFEVYHRVLKCHGFVAKVLTDVDGTPVSLKDLYLKRWLHSNQRVTLLTESPSMDVIIRGVTDKFGLLQCEAADGSGRQFTLQPDGNSFDMMKGLILQKQNP